MLLTAFLHKTIAMTKQEFIAHVLEVLNEADHSIGTQMMIGSDLSKVSVYVEDLYPDAWRRALKLLPLSWFETKSFASSTKVVDAPDGTGFVVLPDDFLLLSSFKMRGWKKPCLTAEEETPVINSIQANEYTRGTPRRPVCVLRFTIITERDGDVFTDVHKKALYYYSLPKTADASTHYIEQALYIPNVKVMPENFEFNENLIEPLTYLCASTVLTSFEKNDAAKSLDNKVIEMI